VTWEVYSIYLLALGAFFITPPDVSQFLIISNALRVGLKRSLLTVAGDLTANAIQMTAAAFGLAAVIATSADAIWYIKWVGVAYLAYIGLRLLLKRNTSQMPSEVKSGTLFRQGFLTSMSNPYAVVFFGALFPQFIDAGAPIWPQLLALGVTYLIVDGLILIGWGWAAERSASRMKAAGSILISRISGILMICAAALLGSKDFTVEIAK
jgi:homoserine/homoserine lactone efflux protein